MRLAPEVWPDLNLSGLDSLAAGRIDLLSQNIISRFAVFIYLLLIIVRRGKIILL